MFNDFLGNSIPFQGADSDFIKALVSSIKSPVKNTQDKTEIDIVKQSINENTKQLKQIQIDIKKLSTDNQKILKQNSDEFKEIVNSLAGKLKNKKAATTEKLMTKLAQHGLKKGSIYVHDIRVEKHLVNITKILRNVARNFHIRTGIRSEKSINDLADSIEKTAGRKSSIKNLTEDMGIGNSPKDILFHNAAQAGQKFSNYIKDTITAAFTAIGGYNLSQPIQDAFGEGVKFQKVMAETLLQNEGLAAAFGQEKTILTRITEISKEEYKTGLDRNVNAKIWLKTYRMGIRDSKEALRISTQAGKISYLMDMDAESTAELFGDWSLKLGASEKQVGLMARSIRDTNKLTGLMGDSLTKSVMASKNMMEYMRSIGKFSAEAAGNIIRLTAAGEKYGVGEQVQELQKLLGGGPVRAALGGSKLFILFQQMLSRSGLREKYQKGGNLLQDKEAMKQFGQGIESQLAMLQKMNDHQRAAWASVMGMEIGDIERVLNAWRESTMTYDDRIADYTNKLAKAVGEEKTNLEHQISDLKIERGISEKKGLVEAADEVNKMAKTINTQRGKRVVEPINMDDYAKLNKEQQAEFLRSRKEEIDRQTKILQSPQEQANETLRDIYNLLNDSGMFVGRSITPGMALASDAAGEIAGGLIGGLGGNVLWNIGKWALGKVKGAPVPSPTVPPGAGGMGPAGAGGMAPKGGGVGPGGAGGMAPKGVNTGTKVGRFGKFGQKLGKGAKFAGKIAGPAALALEAFNVYKAINSTDEDWNERLDVKKDWTNALNYTDWGNIYKLNEAGFGLHKSYLSSFGEKTKGKNIDAIGAKAREDALMQAKSDNDKLTELQRQKEFLESGKNAATRSIAEQEKLKGSNWNPLMWEANASINNRISGEKDRIEGFDKELESVNAQISTLQARQVMSTEQAREEQSEAAKAETSAETSQNISDVASNTGDTVELLQSIQTILTQILQSNQEATNYPDTEAQSKGPVVADYGRMTRNTRSGSISRGMTYTSPT